MPYQSNINDSLPVNILLHITTVALKTDTHDILTDLKLLSKQVNCDSLLTYVINVIKLQPSIEKQKQKIKFSIPDAIGSESP